MTSPAPITDLDGAIANIVAHAVTIGATLSPAITDVARADPVPKGRCCRVWYGGEADPPGFGSTPAVLNGQIVGEIVNVMWFLPVGDSSEVLASNRDKDTWTIANGFRAAIQADSTLGGKCTDLDLAYTTNEYVVSGAAMYRLIHVEIHLAYVEYPTSI